MSVINFTVNYDLFTSEADGDDSGTDLDIAALVGTVTFTPVFSEPKAVLAPGYSPRPAGLVPRPVTGYLDSDGQLYNTSGGSVGVRLWANDPVLRLDALTYRVTFDVTTLLGEQVKVVGGYLPAPSSDVTVNLVNELQPASSFGGPRLSGGEFVDDTVIFAHSDGTTLEPIDVPAGVAVFVDNGDGTWSVGP